MQSEQEIAQEKPQQDPRSVEARLRRSIARMQTPWALLQALLAGITLAVGALWLAVPDANAGEITLSFSIAIGGAVLFLMAQSYLIMQLRRKTRARVPLWRGALLLFGIGILGWLLTSVLDAGQIQDASRAASWSVHPEVERWASADALMNLQAAVWWVLRWIVIGVLLPFAIEGAATGMQGRWARRAAGLVREQLFWAGVLGAAAIATVLSKGLLSWRPQIPALIEFLLTTAKVLTLFCVNVGAVCFVLSLTATLLRDAQRAMPEAPEARPSSRPHQRP